MNGSDLVNRVAARAGVSRRSAQTIVDATLAEIAAGLSLGDRVSLSGFGTFLVRARSARVGRHPRTGDPLDLPERRAVVFRPAPDLSDAVDRIGATGADADQGR